MNGLGEPAEPASGSDSVLAVWERVVAQHGNAVAASDYKTSLTYRALNDRSTHLAWLLVHQGVRPGDIVAMCTERTVEGCVAILAILKAGAAYLPIEPSYPSERIAFMLRDANVTHAVADDKQRGIFAAVKNVVSTAPAAAVIRSDLPKVGSSDLAYVIYTSGSTGTPKGALIEHKSIVRLVCDVGYVRLGPQEVLLHAAPVAFDASTFELFGAWLNGGRVVIHNERIPTARGLHATIHDRGVTTAWLTAGLYNAIIDEAPEALQPLQQLLIGGEALSVKHVRRGHELLPETTIINGYGPTECTTFTTTYTIPRPMPEAWTHVPIGTEIKDTKCFVLDTTLHLVGDGQTGELYVGGAGVARGYLARPELTQERFIERPELMPGRLYKTGDLVRRRSDGIIEYVGRTDNQVKIRGFRIELSEIESVLGDHPQISRTVVSTYEPREGDKRIVAYIATTQPSANDAVLFESLRSHCLQRMPDYMTPSTFVRVQEFPLTPNGKVDLRALPVPNMPASQPRSSPSLADANATSSRTALAEQIASIFAEVLQLPSVGIDDHFFDMGGSSLLALRALARLDARSDIKLQITDLFDRPTARGLAAGTMAEAVEPSTETTSAPGAALHREPIAIIGMSGRFPGAANVAELWRLLCEGKEAVHEFSNDELHPSVKGEASDLLYVKKRGVIRDYKRFDAPFFAMPPREAELMDPQHRLLLETAWATLEHAGYVPETVPQKRIGVFAGSYNNSYYDKHVRGHVERIAAMGAFNVMLASEKDYVATRVAHKLDLRGPALSIHTACSTSLVAIAQAAEALWMNSCEIALAGGASITCPPNSGYIYQEGGMLSRDGRTHSFRAASTGTTFGDGVAMVALKRLSDAQRDNDQIYAVLVGAGVNNDGAEKASFTAPSTRGQRDVIRRALSIAGINARSVGYVEAHGTATPLGDPIEVEALREAFAVDTADQEFAWLGSVKSNLGHLVAAAGVTGVIKAALVLHHGQIPPTIGEGPVNERLDLHHSPFKLVTELTPFPRGQTPRYCGVSSFGVGGTNAHVILREAPLSPPTQASNDAQLLLLSARDEAALIRSEQQLGEALTAQSPNAPETPVLSNVAFTLARGRRAFAQRRFVVAATAEEAAKQLKEASTTQRRQAMKSPTVGFMFTGQGSQQINMGRAIYQRHPLFKEVLDQCSELLRPHLGLDLVNDVLYPSTASESAAERLRQTRFAQPALFSLSYSLARLWLSFGMRPSLMMGHSVGEFVCAALSEVFTLKDALSLVAKRGALMQALPAGSMLTIKAEQERVLPLLPNTIQLASENAKNACVVAGPTPDIEALEQQLTAAKIACRKLQTSHAFHSAMMEPAVQPFAEAVAACERKPPTLRFISTATGLPITDEQACSPAYWSAHLRDPVRFSRAVAQATQHQELVLIEVGPRTTLSQLARPQLLDKTRQTTFSTLCDSSEGDAEWRALLEAVGRAFTCGVPLDLKSIFPSGTRVGLPTYPFYGAELWVEPVASTSPATPAFPPLSLVPPVTSPAIAASLSTVPSAHMAAALEPIAMNSRVPTLMSLLITLLEDVAGIEVAASDQGQSFVELGFDSLFLTQVATAVQKKFEVKLTFRQLMEEYTSPQALVSFLDASLPAGAYASTPPPSAQTATAAVAMQQAAPLPAATAAPMMMPMAVPAAMPSGTQAMMLQMMMQQQMMMTTLMGQMMGQAQTISPAPAPVMLAAPVPAPASAPTTAAPATAANAAATSTTSTPSASQKVVGDTTATPSLPAGFTLADAPDIKKPFGAIAKISLKGSNELTPQQQQRLDTFIKRYNEKTKASKAFTQKARRRHADPRVVTGFRPAVKELIYPIVVQRSFGSRVVDLDGNEYIDCLNGFGCNLFGWQPKFVTDAVIHQLQTGHEIGPQSPLSAECAELFCEMTGADRAAFCNTGSEAVMGCMRIARTVTGRTKIALFTGSYHGIFDEVIVRGTKKLKAIPAAPGIMPNTSENVLVLDYGTDESLEILRRHAHELAAILVEPVQSRRPDFQPREYLKTLRAITEQHGCALIFDEVITGFRTGPGGAQEYFGIKADIASYGKVVGGGLPVGIIAGKREWMDALDGGDWQFGDDSMPTVGVTYFAGTFVRHPLALAAVKSVLSHLKDQGPALQQQMNARTAAFAEKMNAFFKRVGAPLEIRWFASLWKTFVTQDLPATDLMFYMMRDRGLHIYDGFPCFFTTAHTDADIAAIAAAFEASVLEMQESGFLPGKDLGAELNAGAPPVPGAKLGRDPQGNPAWYAPNPNEPGKYYKVGT